MQTKTVYSYDAASGAYAGPAIAHENPRQPGSFLHPAFSTAVPPPERGVAEAAVYRDGAWSLVPDWRGHVYWLADGSRHEITELGIEPPADALDERPPTWDDIRTARDARITASEATWQIETRRHTEQLRLIDMGEPVELYRSPEWMAATELEVLRYHQALRDIPQTYPEPAAVEWPPRPSFMASELAE